jgi:DNA-directed RNA polymerase subunit RPC12/RpoP
VKVAGEVAPVIDSIYRCEICGEESDNPQRWFVVRCNDAQ